MRRKKNKWGRRRERERKEGAGSERKERGVGREGENQVGKEERKRKERRDRERKKGEKGGEGGREPSGSLGTNAATMGAGKLTCPRWAYPLRAHGPKEGLCDWNGESQKRAVKDECRDTGDSSMQGRTA